MTKLHDVIQVGTDSSGRPIRMSRYMAKWWASVCLRLSFTPVIVQGAWMSMSGGGAAASAGYHDGGGCLDIRVRDLTPAQRAELVRVIRAGGAAAWIRDPAHGGMDEHCHLVLGSDFDVDDGAAWQFQRYLAGRDGLASDGPDYHPRPNPLVTKPPAEYLEDDMTPAQSAQLQRVEDKLDAQAAQLEALDAILRRITHSKHDVLAAIKED